jgi:hypothetical protein
MVNLLYNGLTFDTKTAQTFQIRINDIVFYKSFGHINTIKKRSLIIIQAPFSINL